MMKNIFLTGDLEVGKSTIINQVIADFQVSIGGFKTHRYYEQGQLAGFYMESLNERGQTGDLPFIGHCTSQSWTPVPDTFEHFGVAVLKECLEQKPGLIIMDELGFFESKAYQFQHMARLCLDSKIPVLGVLKKADTVFLNSVRERRDILLLDTTPDNREDTARIVHSLLGALVASGMIVRE